MSVMAVVCMFACIQGYWNGPMGLRHGGAVLYGVFKVSASVRWSLSATLATLPTKANFYSLFWCESLPADICVPAGGLGSLCWKVTPI